MIKVIYGDKLVDIAQAVIKNIDNQKLDLSVDNIIVVPDRFSLVAEKLVFETLNIKATFNIHVMGITALARKIISSSGLDCVYADAEESQFVLYRAMQKCKDQFLCFSKNLSQGLCQKVQNSLSLLRSSNISSNEINANVQDFEIGLKNKFHDLALINEKYDEMLDSKLDGTNTLKLFTTLIDSKVNLKNTNFYFCGFDAFTKQGYEIIKAISKNCKNLVIGAFKSRVQNNSHIFDEEVAKTIKQILDDNKMEYVEENCNTVFNLGQKQIFENTFGYKVTSGENYKYFSVYEMPTKQDEVDFVAKQICYLIKNKNIKYSDICVATNEDYFNEIENSFIGYNISFYKDSSVSLYETQLCNYVKFALDLIEKNFDKESILNFISNPFFEIEENDKCDLINFIYENNIEYKKCEKLFEKCEKFKEYYQFLNNFDSFKTIKEIICGIQDMFEKFNVHNKLNALIESLSDNLLTQKLYIQIWDKFEDINEKIKNSIGDEEISLTDFYDFYFATIKDIKVSQVPLSVDSVYVGDISSSFFERTKYVFIVGANQDVIPSVTKDLGLIPDKDIEKLSAKISIAPTVKMINKRNKFKVFDILTNATQELYITYRIADEEGKKMLCSQFVDNIIKLNNGESLLSQNAIEEHFADDELAKLMFNNPTIGIAKRNVSPINANSALLKKAINKVENIDINTQINRENLKFQNKLLKNNVTKISQIESYYDCPFAHFVKYGLKLYERKDGELKANDFGNFIHNFCEIMANDHKNKLGIYSQEEIEKIAISIYEKLLNEDDYKYFIDEENKLTKKLLKNECIRFSKYLNYEQSVSNFKVREPEYRFGFNNEDLSICVDNEKYNIVGVVDRLDVYDDRYFRIIDYKTGSNASNDANLNNLFYGAKIQVYVYLKAIQNKLKLNPFGAFYLPINNKIDSEKADYKLKGYFVGNLSIALNADTTLNENNIKSNLFDIKLKVDKNTGLINEEEPFNAQSTKFVSEKQLVDMMDYAVKMVENAVKDIVNGNTKPSPLEDKCEFCQYSSICAKEVTGAKERKKIYKINKESFGGANE